MRTAYPQKRNHAHISTGHIAAIGEIWLLPAANMTAAWFETGMAGPACSKPCGVPAQMVVHECGDEIIAMVKAVTHVQRQRD